MPWWIFGLTDLFNMELEVYQSLLTQLYVKYFVFTACMCVYAVNLFVVFLCRHLFGGLHDHHWYLLVLVVPCRPYVQNALSRSYNSNNVPLSRSHYSSCREMHASQGSLVFSARDGQPYGALGFCVSTVNLKLAPAVYARPGLSVHASFTSFRW